ncbi:hypothetical protein ASD21_16600 [Caulobacter sp. Root1455]|nr:hypothetical protein ASD38_15930 [Caulobacter sp. Root487D2Y]KQY91976.1 hypothetical protein ASD21_16600 [Caulobacter sp. Root1455]
MIAMIALSGCAAWEHPRGVRPPEETRSMDEQVEARRQADAKARECVIRQATRRGQIEAGRDAKPFPKEKC